MAQFVALAASIAALLLPGGGKKKDAPSSSPMISTTTAVVPSGFFLGFASGTALAFIFIYQFQTFRILERIRWYYHSVLLQSEDEHVDENTCFNQETFGESSIIKTLVDSKNSCSSSLHCSEIILKPGTGFLPRISNCVEMYYILCGKGILRRHVYNQNDDAIQQVELEAKKFVIVQPWEVRSIGNSSREDLIFLRIADSQKGYNAKNGETVVSIPENAKGSVLLGVTSEVHMSWQTLRNFLNSKTYFTT